MTTLNSIIITAITAAFTMPALADQHASRYEWANVIEAVPVTRIIRRPVDEEVCWQEEVYRGVPQRRSRAPVVFGAILGGLIGNQFGHGSGRDAMTLAGGRDDAKKPTRCYAWACDELGGLGPL